MKEENPPPITDEEVAQFEKLMAIWQRRLHMNDWRIVRSRARPKDTLADVTIFPVHRLARYRIGKDWGNVKPSARELENTVIHELLHVLIHPLIRACCGKRAVTPEMEEAEHALIIQLSEALCSLSEQVKCDCGKKT